MELVAQESNLGITTNLSGSSQSIRDRNTINTYTYGSELMFEYTVFAKNGSISNTKLFMRDEHLYFNSIFINV